MRWGLGDVVLVWFAGVVAATFLGGAFLAARGAHHQQDAWDLVVTAVIQYGTWVLVAWWASRRKGIGTLGADFGFRARASSGVWVLVGIGMQLVATVALSPVEHLLSPHRVPQEVVRVLRRSSGPSLGLAVLTVAILAPVVEELLFRGMLQRSLQRRMSTGWAVATTAAVFACAHLVDPGAASVLPALFAVGVLSGWRAVVTGDLSDSIGIHLGFNLLPALATLSALVRF